jgi:hypothetical protein
LRQRSEPNGLRTGAQRTAVAVGSVGVFDTVPLVHRHTLTFVRRAVRQGLGYTHARLGAPEPAHRPGTS